VQSARPAGRPERSLTSNTLFSDASIPLGGRKRRGAQTRTRTPSGSLRTARTPRGRKLQRTYFGTDVSERTRKPLQRMPYLGGVSDVAGRRVECSGRIGCKNPSRRRDAGRQTTAPQPHRDSSQSTSVGSGLARGRRAPWTSVLGHPRRSKPQPGATMWKHSGRDAPRAVSGFHPAVSCRPGLPGPVVDCGTPHPSLEEQESPRKPRAEGRVTPTGRNGLSCGRRP
jgi:hypothetical protein